MTVDPFDPRLLGLLTTSETFEHRDDGGNVVLEETTWTNKLDKLVRLLRNDSDWDSPDLTQTPKSVVQVINELSAQTHDLLVIFGYAALLEIERLEDLRAETEPGR